MESQTDPADLRQPALFFGHGSPMNALGGPFAGFWRKMGEQLPRPRAVLMVSAHWYVPMLAVTAMDRPRTIHDFQGFPDALYQINYPAPGSLRLAEQVRDALVPHHVSADLLWGLDHGAWSVLVSLFPEAAVPVVQLSLDRRQPPEFHFSAGRALRALRDDGVMIIGSGGIIHNLRLARFAEDVRPLDWTLEFDALIRDKLARRDFDSLIHYDKLSADALLAVPTPEHYLPLLYCLGAAFDDEEPSIFTDQVELAAISMTGVAFGAAPSLARLLRSAA